MKSKRNNFQFFLESYLIFVVYGQIYAMDSSGHKLEEEMLKLRGMLKKYVPFILSV